MKQEIISYSSLDSTNLEANRLISSGSISAPTFLTTDYQHNGKGQGKNSWNSDPGKNLLLSWIVFPAFLSVHLQFQLSKAVSLAICDLLESEYIKCKIKWPNDIIYDNKKLGGILIENSVIGNTLKHSIIGIGLNVNQIEFPEFPFRAISMKNIMNNDYSVDRIRELLIERIESRYEQLKNVKTQIINSSYIDRLYRLNEKCEFLSGDEIFIGKVAGVSELGELLIERDSKILSYGFHEVKMHV